MLRILGMLSLTVGLPYLVLSATGPLIQAWFTRTNEGKSPYRLYALSNVGSLAALLTYPFLVEPRWTTRMQGGVWSLGFAAFSLFCGYCATRIWRLQKATTSADLDSRQRRECRETADAAGFICPDNHYLESWGDRESVTGVVSLLQPCSAPLADTSSSEE